MCGGGKGHRMCHFFSCSTSLQILTRNIWLSAPLASREDCRKQPSLQTDAHTRGPSTAALPVLANKAHFSFSVLGNWGCSGQVNSGTQRQCLREGAVTPKVYIMEAEGSGVRLKLHPTYPTLPISPQNVKRVLPTAEPSGSL